MNLEDQALASLLIRQVRDATPEGGSEREVTTIISRPLWLQWLGFCGLPPDTQPTDWQHASTVRVFGSHTIVVESSIHAAVSFATARFSHPKLSIHD